MIDNRNYLIVAAVVLLSIPSASKAAEFKDFLRSSFKSHEELRAIDEERKKFEPLVRELSLLPNPELELEVENILGSGEFRGLKSAETTLLLSQEIPISSVRRKKRELLGTKEEKLKVEKEKLKLKIFSSLSKLYAQILFLKGKIDLLKREEELLSKLRELSETKVKAGRAARVELLLIEREVLKKRSERKSAEERLELLKETLAKYSNLKEEPQGTLRTPLVFQREPESRIENPILKAEKVKRKEKEKEKELVKAEASPHIKVYAGIRHFRAEREFATTVGVAVSLPVFNKNELKIEALEREIKAQELRERGLKREIERLINEKLSRAVALKEKISGIERETLPKSQELYEKLLEGYKLRSIPIERLLRARRELLEEELKLLSLYRELSLLRAEISALKGELDENLFSGER